MFQRDVGNTGVASDGMGPTEDISIKWQYESDRDGTTSAVVDENRIYVGFGTNKLETKNSKIIAFSLEDGTVVWEQAFERGLNTPAVVDESVYIGTLKAENQASGGRHGKLYKLAADTGDINWEFNPTGGVSTPPTVVNDIVYFGSKGTDTDILQGTAYAVNASTSQQLWKTVLGWGTFSAPAVDSDHVYIESRAQRDPFYALDRTDGSVVWKYPMPDFKGNGTVNDGKVYVTGFRDDGRIVALDTQTGDEIWTIETDSQVKTSPAVAEGQLFFGTTGGVFKVVDAETGAPQWDITVGESIIGAPSIVDGVVYVSDRSGIVYAFDANSGDKRFQHDLAEGIFTNPVVVDGTIFLGDRSGMVYALTGKGDPNDPPTAFMNITPTAPRTGESVTLEASGSSDPDGSISSYEWRVDGTSYTGKTVSHTFSNAGEYTVGLTVTDEDGVTDSTTQSINISIPAEAPKPTESPTKRQKTTQTETPTKANLQTQQGQNERLSAQNASNDDTGGIPVLNRFTNSSESLNLGLVALLSGAGGYAGYRKFSTDEETDQKTQE
jgi:outer membrane protein assembly factor BamB